MTGNRIVAVGPTHEVTVPDDAEVVEAAGRYLIPGLWDMHVHSVSAVDAANPVIAAQDWHFLLFLAHGVTGVRNMGDGTVDVTLELSRLIRRQLAEGSRRGPPRFLTAGPTIDGDPYLGHSKKLVVRTAPDARAAVERVASNNADLIKVYENLSRDAYFAIMDEARRRGIPVDGHVPFRVTPDEALGTIESGKLADLVLLDANPLQYIRNTQRIRAVVADGRLFRRGDLDQLLVEVQKLMHPGD